MKPDIVPVSVGLYFIPIKLRIPLKFGPEITTEVVCARVRMTVANKQGQKAQGWGETPLSVQWVWPGPLGYEARHQALKDFCAILAREWRRFAPARSSHSPSTLQSPSSTNPASSGEIHSRS